MNTDLPIIPSFWSFWHEQQSSWDYLNTWTQRLKIPVTAGEILIEQIIRNYLYNHMDWTGQQDECFKNVDSPVNLLQDHDKYVVEHGHSPTWSCGPLSATYIGLLAFYNIPARQVATSHRINHGVDNVAEFWCGSLMKWILVVPHLNSSFSYESQPLSLLEWAKLDRQNIRTKPYDVSGGCKPRCIPDTLDQWFGMSETPRVMCGNYPYSGGDPIPSRAWLFMPVLPVPPEMKIHNTYTYGTFSEESFINPPIFP